MNQTVGNAKVGNAERGWWLLALVAAAFLPSSGLFKPLLAHVEAEAPPGLRASISGALLEGQASEGALPQKRYPPAILQHAALRQKAPMALQMRTPDGGFLVRR